MNWRQTIILIASLIIPQAAGALGAIATAPAISGWYRLLNKPAFNPPAWVFGPAWTVLYLLMGVALFLVWSKTPRTPTANLALIFFAVQLALNVAWSYIFFGLRAPFPALIEIIILWFAILVTVIYFFKVSKAAGALMVPYLLWVTFATVLNGAIWLLNK
jgi:benzodiazapine receptor